MNKTIALGVVMDNIAHIDPGKDTTLVLLQEAEARGWQLHYMELPDLFLKYGAAWGKTKPLQVFNDLYQWYTLGESNEQPLDHFDVILMRKDPPVDMDYIYATYILEHAEANGTLVVNRPQALRDANEKLYATWFPQCMAPTLVSADMDALRLFIEEHQEAVLKPLAGMGGHNIYKCTPDDLNLTVILESLTTKGKNYVMAQRFIPEIYQGDKRIFLIDGDPIPYALARIPKSGEFRGNLAAGGSGQGLPLSERDWWICNQVGPTLRDRGFLFVGLDVIGNYLTEINVTSPTCVRELQSSYDINIAGNILDAIEEKLEA